MRGEGRQQEVDGGDVAEQRPGEELCAGGRRGSRGAEGAQRKKKEEKKSKGSCGKLKRSRDFPVK
jgi:hypothetical protein